MIKTFQAPLLRTVIGLVLAIPISFLTTTIVTEDRLLSIIFRLFLGLIRTIPTLLLAVPFAAIFGTGEATGVLTITVFTFGMVSQLTFQAIGTIDSGPIEAAATVGTNKMQIVIWSIAPQVLNQFTSYASYAFGVSVRASTALGCVGAGGIDVIPNSSLALLSYERVSIIILTILVTIAIVDRLGERVRRSLL